jgi:hypothetical protein
MQQARQRISAPAAAGAAPAAATWKSSAKHLHHGTQQHQQTDCSADNKVSIEPDLEPSAHAAKRQAEQQLCTVACRVYC